MLMATGMRQSYNGGGVASVGGDRAVSDGGGDASRAVDGTSHGGGTFVHDGTVSGSLEG